MPGRRGSEPEWPGAETDEIRTNVARLIGEMVAAAIAERRGGGPPEPPTLDICYTERIKLTATWLNSISAGFFIAGIVAPAASFLYGLAPTSGRSLMELSLAAAVWFLVAILLHIVARAVLGRLRP